MAGVPHPPIEPGDILATRTISNFRPEDIGYLTKPVRIAEWITVVSTRYAFPADLDGDERRWAQCNVGDRYEVETRKPKMMHQPAITSRPKLLKHNQYRGESCLGTSKDTHCRT